MVWAGFAGAFGEEGQVNRSVDLGGAPMWRAVFIGGFHVKHERGRWVWLSSQMFRWRHGVVEGDALIGALWARERGRIDEVAGGTMLPRLDLRRRAFDEDSYIFFVRDGGYRSALALEDILFWAVFAGERA